MSALAEYLNGGQAGEQVRELGARLGTDEFAAVRNIDYVYAPAQIYPLAPCVRPPLPRVVAYAVDMDGTSTTTEPLALHSLDYMVRRFTGLRTRAEWGGLDPVADYPHVIGNSNFRHAEFLLGKYRERLNPDALQAAFVEALCWTLASMTDPQRRRDVTRSAVNVGLSELLQDGDFQRLVSSNPIDDGDVARAIAPFLRRFGHAMHWDHAGALVPALLDIYYMRYHSIMQRIEQGRSRELSRELLGDAGRLLIEPMSGYDVFVALVKGWLGSEAGKLYELMRTDFGTRHPAASPDMLTATERLGRLGQHFARFPAKLALVTASIAYEAHTTMREVFRVMRMRVRDWPVSTQCRARVQEHLNDYIACFDAFVNASDASEHRLKPHPDLYSLALAAMGLGRSDYRACVGLDDTEPGIISLRAAGVGCAVALPNHDTSRQDYRAAASVIHGGLPELILRQNLLVSPECVA